MRLSGWSSLEAPAASRGPVLMDSLRTIFFGTAGLAAVSLARLATQPWIALTGVVTQPDKPRGRDLRLQPTPVKVEALKHGLPVWQPLRCREPSFLDQLRSVAPELIVVVAYGQLLPPAILDLPRHGCLNLHASLLPKYRGAAPIQWALLEGETETGVTLMKMDAGLDTGDLLSKVVTAIDPEDNAATLHDRLATLGADLLIRTLPGYLAGALVPQPQPPGEASHARKITKADGKLDWTRPAVALGNRVRAFNPWPGAFTHLRDRDGGDRLLKLWRTEPLPAPTGSPGEVLEAVKDRLVIACGTGSLRVHELQREGGRRLSTAEFLAGCPLSAGARLE